MIMAFAANILKGWECFRQSSTAEHLTAFRNCYRESDAQGWNG